MQLIYIITSIVITFFIWFLFTRKHFIEKKKEILELKYNLHLLVQSKLDLIPALLELIRKHTDKQEQLIHSVIKLRHQQLRDVQKQLSIDNELKKLLDLGKIYKNLAIDTHFLEIKTEFKQLDENMFKTTELYQEKVRNYNNSKKNPAWFFVLFMPGLRRVE